MSSKSTGFFSMPMILLLVLVYFFRVELYMSGVRAATLISPNPTLDKKLGDYYKELSEKSAVLSQKFYDSVKKDEAAVKDQQAKDEPSADENKEQKAK